MTTAIINDTPHVFFSMEGIAGVYRQTHRLDPGRTITLDVDMNATYREYDFIAEANKSVIPPSLSSDDLVEYSAITFYMTRNDSVAWRGTTKRRSLRSSEDDLIVKSFEGEVSTRIKMVELLHASLEMHLKQVKICHAQCEHLVQTLLKDIQKMMEIHTNVSQDRKAMWKLYDSGKLRNMVSSLDSLLNSLRSAKNLLLKCGSDWRKMSLVVSMPLPLDPQTKTCSEFDLLMGELRWQFAKIRYALYFGNESNVHWKWCTRTCRFELLLPNEEIGGGGEEIGGGGVEIDACSRVNFDRDTLKQCLEDKSIFAWEKLNYLLPWKWSSQYTLDGARKAFGSVLKQRLVDETFVSPSSAPLSFQINHLDLIYGKKISNGSFKDIYQGKWLGQEVAIAIMGCDAEIDDLENLVKFEAGFMLKLHHPNIVACYGYSYTNDPSLPAPNNEATTAGYLVMELMEDDLSRVTKNHMKLRGRFSISVALDVLSQIVEAMVYSHELNIMHRDLKPANCLVKARSVPSSNPQALDVYYDVKLTDFGSARIVDPEDVISEKTSNRGTTRWMAPEMMRPKGNYIANYGKSADVYGFAMICYQVITGYAPYYDKRTKWIDLKQEVCENELRPTFPTSLSCPEILKQLVRDCWCHEPDSRPNFKDIQRKLWSIIKDEEL